MRFLEKELERIERLPAPLAELLRRAAEAGALAQKDAMIAASTELPLVTEKKES